MPQDLTDYLASCSMPQDTTWTNVDHDLCRHHAKLSHGTANKNKFLPINDGLSPLYKLSYFDLSITVMEKRFF